MLYETISNDMKEAMKSHDKDTLSTLRLLKSAVDAYIINNKMERGTASDEVVIDVVSKQVKTHKESIVEFKKGNRQDLVDNLEREIALLSKYLPRQLTSEEINAEINKAFEKVKPTSIKEMGLLMKELTPVLKGKADMKEVNEIIKSRLN